MGLFCNDVMVKLSVEKPACLIQTVTVRIDDFMMLVSEIKASPDSWNIALFFCISLLLQWAKELGNNSGQPATTTVHHSEQRPCTSSLSKPILRSQWNALRTNLHIHLGRGRQQLEPQITSLRYSQQLSCPPSHCLNNVSPPSCQQELNQTLMT